MKRRAIEETSLSFSQPTEPLPEIMVDAIGQVLAQVPGVVEGYLPSCSIEGETSRQVLVVGVASREDIPQVMKELAEKMALLLGSGKFMDIIPFQVAHIPPAALEVPCYERPRPASRKKWWQWR